MNLVTMVTVPREGNEPRYHGNSTALFLKKEVSQFLKFWTCIYCVHLFFALFQMHIVSDL